MLPVSKNDRLVVDVIDLTHEGRGVAKVDGYPIFIENALPGEQVKIHVMKVGKKFAFAKVLNILTESDSRVALEDETLIRTGIAPLQHMSYEAQLDFKQKQVENVMRKVAKMPEIEVLPTMGMEDPTHYRNKAQIPVRKIDGELQTGFYRRNSHDLVPIESFYIQDEVIDQAVIAVREVLRKFNVKPYNEEDNTGLIRHIIVRHGHYTGELMVVLVTRVGKIFQGDKVVAEIVEALPNVTSIIQNINGDQTNVILGEWTRTLYGKDVIVDELLGKRYEISAKSFFQVNTKQAEVLYQVAIDFADLKETDTVIDAYCGTGTIGLTIADKVEHVYGMEIVPEAIKDAKRNQEINDVENVTFQVGAAEYVLPEWQEKGIEADVIIVDPPRKGLKESFIETSAAMQPEKIVYVSCNPSTFARDVKIYAGLGYELTKIQPVDMFPQTPHVEVVGLLTKMN
ncbi:23S rRNA (uracil(1939)-C(5))-methyltransferase RlmD [Vagococcus xieshaowenii]|uniref:23S rRNA (Uracil(1939)-C(5))-methyltransferase RlmD n=1 Tax=Vagococcus xieshaowenii TaxID=2562451 RepID=A0AAJ5JML6_9ENTE|nr:23S rRNA (uracil(1939)-C(5))-methyltransferase RlmD [Vagococcus xieshaowenii]QCA28195.1 23S rRNA (uracil(1939)-C(5))-methyltransferase RlmD [Vagococcus xieshaowenii]TFZ42548.1 23S rRNA (uracil(1939)-C(5))-methyltransferase RlmD [Vagococcus xieshaowenii]